MKTIVTLFLCLICLYTLTAQQTPIDMCDIIRHSLVNKNADTISTLLESDSYKLTDKQKADLYSIRGRMTTYLNKKNIKKRSSSTHPKLKASYADLTKAISLIPEENDKLKYIARRYYVLEKYKPYYEDYKSDQNKLIANGLKKDKVGLGASAVVRFDGDFWVGAELSLFSGYAPPFQIKDKNGDIVLSKKMTISASGLVFGFTRNLEKDLNDYSFSLLRIEAPIFIDITKFGYIQAPGGKNHWYYRPEIGIGYSIFQLSSGYNLFYKNDGTENLSHFSLNFRTKFVF